MYKGSSAQKFLDYRREKSTDREGNFHNTVSEVLQWLEDRAEERCDVQIVRLIRSMMRTNYEDRPSAEQVWKTLTTCTSGSLLYFCGPCCMPLICNDPLLDEDPDTDPSEAKYTLSKSGTIPNDLQFKEQYQAGKGPEVTWIRNLRHWPYATLDVVKSESLYPQARKRIFLNSGNQYGSDRAYNEAEILRQVKHRHIVALRSTYQHPGMLTLHYEPAADYDLRSFLGLVELRMTKLQDLSKDSQLQKDLHLLNESFGCLSAALSTVHQARYDHGEIRPANILVHDNRIFISKFSFGLKFGGSTTSSVYRYISPFGLIDLGNRGSRPSRDLLPPTLDPEVV